MSQSRSGPPGVRGRVNANLEAHVEVEVSGPQGVALIPCLVDTGFSGELLLPESAIAELGLNYLGSSEAELADGSVVALRDYAARIEWHGAVRFVWLSTVREAEALIGTELLDGHRLTIDYAARTVEVA